MKTSLIIHGHFYQPPRENPFTGIVPDQDSAGKFINWNEAIFNSCYRPNAYSRYLTSDGKIKKVFNNYSNISFNMGPSLLNWMDSEHHFFMNKLLEADRESIQKFGHSNVIAQAYSHTILPLDSPLIRKLDINWAIEDYKARFKHNPEGFWCPECAVNLKVIDELANAGIKFIILSPWQATKINEKPLNGKPAPCDRPFIVKGVKKKITVFFYDPDYASGISFGHMLRDADSLYQSLLREKKIRNNPSLINWATDGEIYGHHEAFGDMALAALVEKINNDNQFEITNYGSYLEKHPATETATLWLGEDNKGSSWSCSHGVGRWERDCGCHTGGDISWTQEWRGPLRKAFNNLEKATVKVLKDKFEKLFGKDFNYEDLLVEYGHVLSHSISLENFLSEITKEESIKSQTAILLDLVNNLVKTYTSCGWFFNDISGIEPVQNMNYAYYVAQVLSELTGTDYKKKLLNDLSKAKSNIPEYVNGKTILQKSLPIGPSEFFAAGYFVLNRYFALESDYQNKFGFFRLDSFSDKELKITKETTLESYIFSYSYKTNDKHKFEVVLNKQKEDKFVTISTAVASKRSLRVISSWIENKLGLCVQPETFKELLHNMDEYILITTENKSALNEDVFIGNLGLCIKALQSQVMLDSSLNPEDRMRAIKQISGLVRNWGNSELKSLLNTQIENQFDYVARKISTLGLSKDTADNLLSLLEATRSEGLNPDITLLQDVIYGYLTRKYNSPVSNEVLNRLSEALNFSFRFEK